jgi:hypothetical protein
MLLRIERIPELASMAIRRLSAGFRCLPNAIIVGAQKSGTSSLFSYLTQHPEIRGSFRKEVHFFDGGLVSGIDNFKKGKHWYRAHFPLENATSEARIIEATPSYLFVPCVPARIFQQLPEVKLIVVLRDPVERAISHFFHEVRAGREKRPIMSALVEEDDLLAPIWRSGEYKSREFLSFSYKARGRYAEQLSRYFDLFSRNQILVLSSKALFGATDETLSLAFNFLGAADSIKCVKDHRPKNVGKNKSPVESSVREYLVDYYAPYNDRLCEILGEQIDW